METSCKRRVTAFTLVELLVVIAIIGILVALLLPAIQAAREAARRSQCANNLKNIGLALINYADVNKRLPPATPLIMATGEATGGTWVVKIWPYIEEQSLYDRFDHKKSSNDKANEIVVAAPLPWLVCPSDSEKQTPNGVDPPGQHNDGGSGVFNPKNSPVMSLWYPVSLGPTHMDACPFCPPVPAGTPNYCCQGAAFGSNPAPANDPTTPAGKAPSFAGLFGRYPKGIRLREITDGTTHVFMAGETIPYHCRYICALSQFPIRRDEYSAQHVSQVSTGRRGCRFQRLHRRLESRMWWLLAGLRLQEPPSGRCSYAHG